MSRDHRHEPGRQALETRRHLFSRAARGFGTAALAALLPREPLAAPVIPAAAGKARVGGLPGVPHFPAKARRAISLFFAGAPSQIELVDYKPKLAEMFDRDLPPSVRGNQRLTTMSGGQSRFPLVGSAFKFKQHGESGAWMSELLPHLSQAVDDMTIIKTVWTGAINHDPAITYIQTGNQIPGKPSLGAWCSYGLGTENQDLPTYVVLTSKFSSKTDAAQALFARLWGSGYLPSQHQGVSLRSSGDPVLYLSDPPGVDRLARRQMLDAVVGLNAEQLALFQDPEINTRITQYEMAFRMQTSVPELIDVSKEPASTFALYGPEARIPGTFASNCLMARRMAERGVRFTQIFHRGWDHHTSLPKDLPLQCHDVDQAVKGLIFDLKQRGMLDETLVVAGGEFGRTVYCQGKLTRDRYGRDHHPRCFPVVLAGGGVKRGLIYGETDDFSYNVVKDPVHIRDLNATILHCLGVDHTRLTFKYAGLDQRLTGVEPAKVVNDILV